MNLALSGLSYFAKAIEQVQQKRKTQIQVQYQSTGEIKINTKIGNK